MPFPSFWKKVSTKLGKNLKKDVKIWESDKVKLLI